MSRQRSRSDKVHPFNVFKIRDLIELEDKVYKYEIDFDRLNTLIQYYAVDFLKISCSSSIMTLKEIK